MHRRASSPRRAPSRRDSRRRVVVAVVVVVGRASRRARASRRGVASSRRCRASATLTRIVGFEPESRGSSIENTDRARSSKNAHRVDGGRRRAAMAMAPATARSSARPTARRTARRAARRATRRATTTPRRALEDDDARYSNETKLRSEAQAPFRVARQFLYGACAASATIGFGIATIQAATKAAGAPNAPPLEGSLENLAIDGAALATFAWLYAREEAARERQMARIGREERLGRLRVELAGGKTVRLEDLRSFSRVVVVSGDEAYARTALEDAEDVREALIERGVLVVPVIRGDGAIEAPSAEDRKFRCTPLRANDWLEWVAEQKKMSKVSDDKGVYVGLRMDGRVRSSGTGRVPFNRFAVELPPVDSWGGALDGFDGRVGVDN
jgi:hypothetical protein